jgi:hypothetical protein
VATNEPLASFALLAFTAERHGLHVSSSTDLFRPQLEAERPHRRCGRPNGQRLATWSTAAGSNIRAFSAYVPGS